MENKTKKAKPKTSKPAKKTISFKIPAIIFLLIVVIGVSLFVYIKYFKSTPNQEEYLAFVDGTAITKKDVEIEKQYISAVQPDLFIDDSTALNQTIRKVLFLNQAELNGVSAPSEIADEVISSVSSRFASEDEFIKALEEKSMTLAEYKKDISERITVDLFRNVLIENITLEEADLQEYYSLYAQQFQLLGINYTFFSNDLEMKEGVLAWKKQDYIFNYIGGLEENAVIVFGPFTIEEQFALCLLRNDVKLYTTHWCCQEQKEVFGESYNLLDIIDCAEGLEQGQGQTQLCDNAGVTGYPTWEVNGNKYEKTKTKEFLSKETGCKI